MQALASTRGRTLTCSNNVQRRTWGPRTSVRARHAQVHVVRAAAFNPPTVSETKRVFLEKYNKPIPSIYNGVIQELLVQQHFVRYSVKYDYNEVFALGFVSVFDQVLDGLDEAQRTDIFNAYIDSLGENPAQYRKDAAALEQQASELSGPEQLVPEEGGNAVQQALNKVASKAAAGNFAYNKFFAIGLFRLLELTGAKEPAALEKLVKSVNVKPESVNKDLMLYKGILSKLSAAKELMREFLERERRKQAEREAEKAAKAEKAAA